MSGSQPRTCSRSMACGFTRHRRRHAGLAALFNRTHWSARSGASGVWRQAFLRVPGAQPSPAPIRFRGVQTRAVLVPLAAVLAEMEPVAP